MKTTSVIVEEKFLNKTICITHARMLVSSKKIDMDIKDCAKEIYAHAVIYYSLQTLIKYHIPCPKYLIEHANPIDLTDGTDTKARTKIYNLIWTLVPSR